VAYVSKTGKRTNARVRDARAKKAVFLRMDKTLTIRDIADKLKVGASTVERDLKWAEKAKLFAKYEKDIFDGLVPKAIRSVESALDDGDGQLGLKILEGVRLIRGAKTNPTETEKKDDEDLMVLVSRLREQEALEGETIDAKQLGEGQKLLPTRPSPHHDLHRTDALVRSLDGGALPARHGRRPQRGEKRVADQLDRHHGPGDCRRRCSARLCHPGLPGPAVRGRQG
jgi:hypothetical protein